MTTTLKLTVMAERTMFGKLNGAYTASIGALTGRGKTREQALAALECELAQLDRYSHVRRYLVTPGGTTFALSYAIGGWCYDIVRRDGSNSGCMLGRDYVTDGQAMECMRKHFDDVCRDETMALA